MARRFWIVLLLVSCVGAAAASGPASVRKQIESTRLVNGTIDLGADGRVDGYTLERREKLPPAIAGLIARVVPQWRFEPVEVAGQSSAVRTNMSLRLVAKKLESGDFTIELRGAQFYPARPTESIGKRRLAPPSYPEAAARGGVGGTVYLVLRIAPDGQVEESVAEQVNLRYLAGESEMARWRGLLERAALRAAMRWTFDTPAEEVGRPFWSARVPVDFVAPDQRVSDDEWQAYIPGPRQPIPWIRDASGLSAADALAADGVYSLNSTPRLLSSLDPS